MHRLDSRHPDWLLLPLIMGLLVAIVYPASYAYGALASAPQWPDLEVALAWEGYARPPGWTEIYVTLTNEADSQSASEWHGDLLITDNFHQVTYRQALKLPAHSRKHYRIPIFIDEIYPLDIALKSDNPDLQKSGNVSSLSFRRPINGLVCAIVDAQTLSRLERLIFKNAPECGSTVYLGPNLTELPETVMAWDTIDVLILNGVDTTALTPDQQQALLAWVSAGGHLVIGGGPTLPQTIAGLPNILQIAHFNPTVQLTRTLSLGDSRATLNDQIVTPLSPKSDIMALVTWGSIPLAVYHNVGKGQVDLIGWDLGLAEDAFPWVSALWADDASPAVTLLGTEELSPSAVAVPNNSQALMQIPTNIIPKLGYLLLLFPLYLFLMGPGTLLITRRLRHLIPIAPGALAWILFPIWIILGITLMAFQLTGTFSQSFPIIHDIAVISAPGPNLPARVVQSTAIFAPQIRRLRWQSAGTPRPLWGQYTTDGWYNGGDPFNVQVLHTGSDKSQIQVDHPIGILTWASEGVTISPNITATLSLANIENHFLLQGEISSNQEIREVRLLLDGGRYQYPILQQLSASRPITISQVLTDSLKQSGRPPSQDFALCAQVGKPRESPVPTIIKPPSTQSPAISEERCYLSGIMGSVPFPYETVGGTYIAETCLIYTIPCPQQHAGPVKITGEHLRTQIENGWIDEQGTIYVSRPATTVDYQLPTFLDIQELTRLTLKLQNDNPEQTTKAGNIDTLGAEFALWKWEEKTWEPFPPVEQASKIVLEGPIIQQFVTPQSGFRVRLTPPDNTSKDSSVHVEITLEGKW
jgi:hypothetical protein